MFLFNCYKFLYNYLVLERNVIASLLLLHLAYFDKFVFMVRYAENSDIKLINITFLFRSLIVLITINMIINICFVTWLHYKLLMMFHIFIDSYFRHFVYNFAVGLISKFEILFKYNLRLTEFHTFTSAALYDLFCSYLLMVFKTM